MSGRFAPIAIVGMGVIFPQARNLAQYWRNILTGKDLISDVPSSHWLIDDYYDPDPDAQDKTYCKRGAFIPDIDFHPMEYGIPPSNIPVLDTSQLLALVVAKQVLGDIKTSSSQALNLNRVSVILSTAALEALQYTSARMQRPIWTKALREAGLDEALINQINDKISNSYAGWQENTFPGLLGNVVAGRIANRFNFGGTNCATDAACAGSLAALSMSINELQLHQCDMVISGGVDTLNDIVMYMCFSKTKALSYSGDCRPFSDKADGTILGEGIGMYALKRLEDAEREKNKIYAVIRGLGSSSDGRSKSIYAPVPEGQSQAILRAYESAGYSPNTVELIEAHGTGTKAGDAAEWAGLNLAFSKIESNRKNYCALGSIKSQIGHTKSAAGAAGLLKAALALRHKTLPPTIKVEKPNPDLDLKNSPFYLNTAARPWINTSEHPRRAGVSAFGFGGSNFHVTLEEYIGPQQHDRLRVHPVELILLGADNVENLIKACKTLLPEAKIESLAYLARRSQEDDTKKMLARLALLTSDENDLQNKLQTCITSLEKNTQQPFLLSKEIYFGFASDPGRVAFLFPGQGSQYLNMGADLVSAFDSSLLLWEKAARFDFSKDKKLSEVVFPNPVFETAEKNQQEQVLAQTDWAQPALAVTSLIYLSLLASLGIKADATAGQGFGESIALYAANEISEENLLTLAKNNKEIHDNPLHFQHQIENLYQTGVRTFIEVGPQNILSNRVSSILSKQDVQIIPLDIKNENGLISLYDALARLYVTGLNPAFSVLWQEYEKDQKAEIQENTYSIKINGTNFGKPYPAKDQAKIPVKLNVTETVPPEKIHYEPRPIKGNIMQPSDSHLFDAYQELQRQLIEAHNTYQRTMAETHISFLNTISQMSQQIMSPDGVLEKISPSITPPPVMRDKPAPIRQAPPKIIKPVNANPAPSVEMPRVSPSEPVHQPVHQAAPQTVAHQPVVNAEPAQPANQFNLKQIILDTVVEKTGYPAEMLKFDMAIEADLGIDSIKRVEILSALVEKVPNLPEISSDQLTKIHTLEDIFKYAEQYANNPSLAAAG